MLGWPPFGYVFKSSKTSLNAGNWLAADYSVDAVRDTSFIFKGAHKEMLVEDSSDVLRPRLTLAFWCGRPILFKSIVKGQGDRYNLGDIFLSHLVKFRVDFPS